jgi:hypothetical protein
MPRPEQGAPQLVEDDEVVAARFQACVGQDLGDVHRGEAGRPARQQRGGLQVELAFVDPGQVERDRLVAPHRLGGLFGEDRPEPRGARGEALQRRLQPFGDFVVPAEVDAVQRGVAQVLGCLAHDLQQVFDDRDTVVPVVEDL